MYKYQIKIAWICGIDTLTGLVLNYLRSQQHYDTVGLINISDHTSKNGSECSQVAFQLLSIRLLPTVEQQKRRIGEQDTPDWRTRHSYPQGVLSRILFQAILALGGTSLKFLAEVHSPGTVHPHALTFSHEMFSPFLTRQNLGKTFVLVENPK